MPDKAKSDKLKEYKEQTMVCTSCGYCKSVCPAFACTLWDHNTARSKVMYAYGILEGEIEPDESIIQAIFECSTCADCMRRCPSKVETLDIIMAARTELAERGLIPENMKMAMDNISECNNPLGQDPGKRIEFVPEEAMERIGKGGDVLMYLGCVTSLEDMKMVGSIFKLLERGGVDYTYLGNDEPCCGLLDYLAGSENVDTFGDRMKKAIDTLEPRPKTMVASCPGCYRSLNHNYPEEGVDLGVEVKHITEYLDEILTNGDLLVKKPLEGNVFYHDPCDLGRHSGIYEPPRKLLSHFAEVKEFEYNREEARCCGGGGGLQSTNYGMTEGIAKNRVMEAIELGADMIVSACPGCKSTLSTAALDLKQETGKKVKVLDLVEIVAKYTKAKE